MVKRHSKPLVDELMLVPAAPFNGTGACAWMVTATESRSSAAVGAAHAAAEAIRQL